MQATKTSERLGLKKIQTFEVIYLHSFMNRLRVYTILTLVYEEVDESEEGCMTTEHVVPAVPHAVDRHAAGSHYVQCLHHLHPDTISCLTNTIRWGSH